MAVSYVGVGAVAAGVGASTAPAIPAGVAADDLLVLLDVAWSSALGTPTTPGTPAGWTQKSTYFVNGVRITWFYRRWASGVTAPTVTGGSGTNEHESQIIALRGVAPSGDPTDVLGTAAATASSSTAIGTVAGVTTTQPGGVVLVAGARNNDFTDGASIGPLTGQLSWVELVDRGGQGGAEFAWSWDYALTPTALAITAKTFPISGNSVSAPGAGQMWAIGPGVTGPTVDAGVDVRFQLVGTALARTATENDNGSTITARAWTVVSGPTGSGTTIGTAAALSWIPTVPGSYVLRYSATTSVGTGSDDVAVTVLPAYVRGITVATGTTSTVTVAMPAGVLAGDHLLAVCVNDFIAASATGWDSAAAGGSSANDTALNILRRTATASEPASDTFAVGASTSATIAIIALAKESVATTFDVAPALATLAVANATTAPATPSITTTAANALLLTVYGTAEAAAGYAGHTPPGGMLELVDHFPAGTGRALHIAGEVIAVPGATGARTATVTGSAANYLSQAFAVAPTTDVPKTATDTAAGVETIALARISAVTDAATGADAAQVAAQTAVTDSATGSETVALTQARAVTDSASGSETVALTAITYKTVSDSATGSETVAVDIPELLYTADSAVGSDSASLAAVAALLDSATGSEALALARTTAVADAAAGSDAVAVKRISTIADTAAGSDAVTSLARTSDDTDTAVGSESIVIVRFSAVTDLAVGSDTAIAGPRVTDSATGSETVEVIVIPVASQTGQAQRSIVTYKLVVVARIPQVVGPPAFIEVDPLEWTTLTWATTLSKPQELTVTCPVTSITESVAQRLRAPDRLPTELWLLRDGQKVFAGPLMGGRRSGDTVTLNASGLLAYLHFMIVVADKRFDQQDQFAMAAWLVDQWQVLEHGHFGIDTSSVGVSGRLRDGSYIRNEIHNVGRRIEELGQRADGFDTEVDPESRKLQLWYPSKGVDRSSGGDAVVFDERNITSAEVMFSIAPGDLASEGFGTGASSGADTSLWSAQANLELRATFGRAAVTGSWSDVSEQSTLDDHTRSLLDARDQVFMVPGPNTRVTPDADLSAYAEGDTVAYQLDSTLGVAGAFRIRRRVVQVAATGLESVDLEFV